MLIGYARTSTVDQQAGLSAQKRDLENAGVEKLYTEQVSSVGTRVQLEATLEFARDGDTLIVTKLDRLARSTAHLLSILELLERKSVGLRILDFGGGAVDTCSPTGKLMLTMFGAMAQFEREMMLERQREGIVKAKREGKYKGRKPTARAKVTQIVAMHMNGRKPTEIARELGIGRASVYRLLSDFGGGDGHTQLGLKESMASEADTGCVAPNGQRATFEGSSSIRGSKLSMAPGRAANIASVG